LIAGRTNAKRDELEMTAEDTEPRRQNRAEKIKLEMIAEETEPRRAEPRRQS
jgi:hypothetical protein